jgi:hypothetical protein
LRESFGLVPASFAYRRKPVAACLPAQDGALEPKEHIMQRLVFVRYTVKPDQIATNEKLSRAVFKELRAAAPENLAYALFRNGADFVHSFVNLGGSDSEALIGLPSFKAFSQDVAARAAGPIEQIRLDLNLLESYGLHSAELADAAR